MIFFKLDDQGYAVDASELAGVAGGCPFVTHPGLPSGVLGLVQWSGKVFPVVDALGGDHIEAGTCQFLFSVDNLRSPFKEVAIAVPSVVRVFFVESSLPAPEGAGPAVVAKLLDADGNEALQIKLSKIVEQVARRMNPGGRGEDVPLRLELGLREAVVERCGPLLSELERLTSELVSRPPREGSATSACDAIVGVLDSLRLACSTVPVLEPVTPLIDAFKTLVAGVRAGSVSLTARHAAIFSSAVAALTQAIGNLGTESRAAKLVPKVLAEVTRLLKTLAPVVVPPALATPVVDLARAFRESFLEDEDGNFSKIAELARGLGAGEVSGQAVEELFRQVHTVKGNAMALGLAGLANFAHTLEAELDRARTQPSLSADAARSLAETAGTLLVLRERSRGDAQPAAPAVERAAFLTVRRGDREWLVPCAQVTEVLRKPRVLALPRSPGGAASMGGDVSNELLGAVRSRGLFVPLIGARAEMPASPAWAVVLREGDSAAALICIPLDDIGAIQDLPASSVVGKAA